MGGCFLFLAAPQGEAVGSLEVRASARTSELIVVLETDLVIEHGNLH